MYYRDDGKEDDNGWHFTPSSNLTNAATSSSIGSMCFDHSLFVYQESNGALQGISFAWDEDYPSNSTLANIYTLNDTFTENSVEGTALACWWSSHNGPSVLYQHKNGSIMELISHDSSDLGDWSSQLVGITNE